MLQAEQQTLVANVGAPTTVNISQPCKDSFWKSLIRAFRRYLRKDVLSKQKMKLVLAFPIENQGQAICVALGITDINPRTTNIMLLLFFSHRYVSQKRPILQVREIMAPYMSDIWPKFFLVFTDSNHRQRKKFFEEPLI